ncbi:DUF4405 domain-containing protein [Undibacterium sp. Rencai35W]|uniref:DUF4405 domain-containing protein n=1 Tax=Undibacterium sp. Rencai35W TaxID=3413046 RepID=UPI003BF16D30
MRTHKHSLHHPVLPKNRHQHFRLERWHRISLYLLGSLLSASGLVWLIAHFLLKHRNEFGDSVHPLEHPAMQVHGALAMLTCFAIGTLLQMHIRRAHRAHRNRWSGWSMISVLGWLVLSGYALYYLASEESRVIWSVGHWSIGLALPLLLILHIVLGRRSGA